MTTDLRAELAEVRDWHLAHTNYVHLPITNDAHKKMAATLTRVIESEAEMRAELEKAASVLPGTYYMDPPDGGDVSVSEQLRRMAKDAERYRWWRAHACGASWDAKRNSGQKFCDRLGGAEYPTHEQFDAAVEYVMHDSAREGSNG